MPLLSQNYGSWASITLGNNSANGRDPGGLLYNIGNYGCFVTSIAMLFNSYQRNFTNPRLLNDALKANSGFAAGDGNIQWGSANWSRIAPAGLAWRGRDRDWSHADRELQAGRPVLVEATWFSGSRSGKHMVVIARKSADGTYSVNDPQDGGQYTWTRDSRPGAFMRSGSYQIDYFHYFNGG